MDKKFGNNKEKEASMSTLGMKLIKKRNMKLIKKKYEIDDK